MLKGRKDPPPSRMSRPGNVWRRIHGRIARRPTNFSWIMEGMLAGSGMPTSSAELGWVLRQGVKSIVTMTENPLPDSWIGGLNYLHVPTPDLTAPDMDGIDAAVEFIRGQITSRNAVMVHCAAGMGRAGTILACYLVKYEKHSAKEAIQKIRGERPGSIQSASQEMAVGFYEKHVS